MVCPATLKTQTSKMTKKKTQSPLISMDLVTLASTKVMKMKRKSNFTHFLKKSSQKNLFSETPVTENNPIISKSSPISTENPLESKTPTVPVIENGA